MKLNKIQWGAIAVFLMAALGATFYAINTPEAEAQDKPAVKVKICPWAYDTFEHREESDTVKIGNWVRVVTSTDYYNRPLPGIVELADRTPTPEQKVRSVAKPYLDDAVIDTVYNIKKLTDECYFIKH